MSLMLNQGTVPGDLFTKSHPFDGGRVLIGDYDLSMKDFVALAEYVLTNTDLYPDDPRLEFVEKVKRTVQDKGHNPDQKRLVVGEIAAT